MSGNERICSEVIELLLGNRIGKIKRLITENQIANKVDRRYIRLDVTVETEDGNIYDVEMQTYSRKNLPKRMRLYSSMIDANYLDKNEDFENLPKTFIIFICTFDFYKKGKPLYFFRNLCNDEEDLDFRDETYKLVANTTAFHKAENEKLRAFLEYVQSNQATDELTRRIDKMVNSPNYQVSALEGFRAFSMIEMDTKREAFDEGFDEGFGEGLSEGRTQGISEGISQGAYQKACETAIKLREMGLSLENIAKATGLSEEEIMAL